MDPRMMNAWLQSQSQKQQPSTRSMELKRQGMAITEQLNAQEEKYAKSHKSMLNSMIKQYGSDKGTKVFYATVREKVKKLNEDAMVKDVPTTSQDERVPVMNAKSQSNNAVRTQAAQEKRTWEQKRNSPTPAASNDLSQNTMPQSIKDIRSGKRDPELPISGQDQEWLDREFNTKGYGNRMSSPVTRGERVAPRPNQRTDYQPPQQ
jgi:hypothetical protein